MIHLFPWMRMWTVSLYSLVDKMHSHVESSWEHPLANSPIYTWSSLNDIVIPAGECNLAPVRIRPSFSWDIMQISQNHKIVVYALTEVLSFSAFLIVWESSIHIIKLSHFHHVTQPFSPKRPNSDSVWSHCFTHTYWESDHQRPLGVVLPVLIQSSHISSPAII